MVGQFAPSIAALTLVRDFVNIWFDHIKFRSHSLCALGPLRLLWVASYSHIHNMMNPNGNAAGIQLKLERTTTSEFTVQAPEETKVYSRCEYEQTTAWFGAWRISLPKVDCGTHPPVHQSHTGMEIWVRVHEGALQSL